jgi:bifunctional enzyme CysN/CysC
MVLPGKLKTRVKEIWDYDQPIPEALTGSAVTITIEDEIDISRGDMLVRTNNVPEVSRELEAVVCWMNETALDTNKQYLIMHSCRTVHAIPGKLYYKIDVNTLHRSETDKLGLNEIGRVRFTLSQPLFFDPYKINNDTGSFIIIDPGTNVTVGAGMIRGIQAEENRPKDAVSETSGASPNVVWEPWNIPRESRSERFGHPPIVLWFTGVPGAGKSTIARDLEKRLWQKGFQTMLLDGDQLRHGLCRDLGFSDQDRQENIRRVGELARLFYEHGNIVICTFVSPFKADRDNVRNLFPNGDFIEIQVSCSKETAMKRDPKGLYAKALKGELKGLTGFDGIYEFNSNAELQINTDQIGVEECVQELEMFVLKRIAYDS